MPSVAPAPSLPHTVQRGGTPFSTLARGCRRKPLHSPTALGWIDIILSNKSHGNTFNQQNEEVVNYKIANYFLVNLLLNNLRHQLQAPLSRISSGCYQGRREYSLGKRLGAAGGGRDSLQAGGCPPTSSTQVGRGLCAAPMAFAPSPATWAGGGKRPAPWHAHGSRSCRLHCRGGGRRGATLLKSFWEGWSCTDRSVGHEMPQPGPGGCLMRAPSGSLSPGVTVQNFWPHLQALFCHTAPAVPEPTQRCFCNGPEAAAQQGWASGCSGRC